MPDITDELLSIIPGRIVLSGRWNFTGILNTFYARPTVGLYNLAAIAYLLVLSGKLAYMMIGWYGFRQRISKDHQNLLLIYVYFTSKSIELGIKRQGEYLAFPSIYNHHDLWLFQTGDPVTVALLNPHRYA